MVILAGIGVPHNVVRVGSVMETVLPEVLGEVLCFQFRADGINQC